MSLCRPTALTIAARQAHLVVSSPEVLAGDSYAQPHTHVTSSSKVPLNVISLRLKKPQSSLSGGVFEECIEHAAFSTTAGTFLLDDGYEDGYIL